MKRTRGASLFEIGVRDTSISNTTYPESLTARLLCLALLGLLGISLPLRAAEKQDLDAYTIKFSGFWFYTQPTGTFTGTGGNGSFDFQRDTAFNSYSTLAGGVDWKFTRKNHLTFSVIPFDRTKSRAATRTISFQGQTFNVGAFTTTDLKVNAYSPGYQYDILRRKRGHLGIKVQLNIFDILGSLSAAAQVVNGAPIVSHRAQGTLRAPLPVAGPDIRYYLIPNSNRLFVTGNVLGMYFFGYGNYISTLDTLGFTATKHLSIRAGFLLGSRLNVNNNAATRIGIRLTQKGPVVGIEVPF